MNDIWTIVETIQLEGLSIIVEKNTESDIPMYRFSGKMSEYHYRTLLHGTPYLIWGIVKLLDRYAEHGEEAFTDARKWQELT